MSFFWTSAELALVAAAQTAAQEGQDREHAEDRTASAAGGPGRRLPRGRRRGAAASVVSSLPWSVMAPAIASVPACRAPVTPARLRGVPSKTCWRSASWVSSTTSRPGTCSGSVHADVVAGERAGHADPAGASGASTPPASAPSRTSGRSTAPRSWTSTAAARSPGTARARSSATRSSACPSRSTSSATCAGWRPAMIAVCAELGVEAGRVEGRSGTWVLADEPRPGPQDRGHRHPGGAGRDDARLRAQLRLRPARPSRRSCPAASRDAGVTSLSAELGRDVTRGRGAAARRAADDRGAGALPGSARVVLPRLRDQAEDQTGDQADQRGHRRGAHDRVLRVRGPGDQLARCSCRVCLSANPARRLRRALGQLGHDLGRHQVQVGQVGQAVELQVAPAHPEGGQLPDPVHQLGRRPDERLGRPQRGGVGPRVGGPALDVGRVGAEPPSRAQAESRQLAAARGRPPGRPPGRPRRAAAHLGRR